MDEFPFDEAKNEGGAAIARGMSGLPIDVKKSAWHLQNKNPHDHAGADPAGWRYTRGYAAWTVTQ